MTFLSPGYVASGTSARLFAGSGVVTEIVMSHVNAAGQTVVLYDGSSAAGVVIARFAVPPNVAPVRLGFPRPHLSFRQGLFVVAAACEVIVFGQG